MRSGMTTQIDRSALVRHTPRQMFDLINDVGAYPEFLPWCSKVQIHASSPEEILASIEVAKGGIKQRFTTRNRLEPHAAISMALVDGPFQQLAGRWEFLPLGDSACKVALKLDFTLTHALSGMALSNVVAKVASDLVDAFCRRADHCYG